MKITQNMKGAVNAYLIARAAAETMRARVDNIAQRLLDSASYFVDKKNVKRGRKERVTKHKDAWLMPDDEHKCYLSDLRDQMEKEGLKITAPKNAEHHDYYCPALVLENYQTEAENLVIDSTAEMMGEKDFRNRLFCAGMDKYKQFVDLSVKAVVNHPDFVPPSL